MSAPDPFAPPETKEGDIVERCEPWADGTVWVRKWIRETPGMLHLCWVMEVKGTSWGRRWLGGDAKV